MKCPVYLYEKLGGLMKGVLEFVVHVEDWNSIR